MNRSAAMVRPTTATPRDADRSLRAILGHALAIGVTLVVLLPAARGMHELIGWLPLWLLGMPLSALATLHLRRKRQDAVSSRRRGALSAVRSRPATVRPARPVQTVRNGPARTRRERIEAA